MVAKSFHSKAFMRVFECCWAVLDTESASQRAGMQLGCCSASTLLTMSAWLAQLQKNLEHGLSLAHGLLHLGSTNTSSRPERQKPSRHGSG